MLGVVNLFLPSCELDMSETRKQISFARAIIGAEGQQKNRDDLVFEFAMGTRPARSGPSPRLFKLRRLVAILSVLSFSAAAALPAAGVEMVPVPDSVIATLANVPGMTNRLAQESSQ
jgi:hypothetical protein